MDNVLYITGRTATAIMRCADLQKTLTSAETQTIAVIPWPSGVGQCDMARTPRRSPTLTDYTLDGVDSSLHDHCCCVVSPTASSILCTDEKCMLPCRDQSSGVEKTQSVPIDAEQCTDVTIHYSYRTCSNPVCRNPRNHLLTVRVPQRLPLQD